MVKTFKDGTHDVRFDPYGHFGQAFQSNDFENNINQYKICEIKPPSVEKVHKYIFKKKRNILSHNFSVKYNFLCGYFELWIFYMHQSNNKYNFFKKYFLLSKQFLDSDGISLDVSAPAFTIPGK